MPNLGVLVVHGLCDGPTGPIADMAALQRRLNRPEVDFELAYWGDVVGRTQAAFAQRERLKCPFDLLRNLTVDHLTDVFAYQMAAGDPFDSTYQAINSCIGAHYDALYRRLTQPSRILIVAHSLGSIIVSNFLWDRRGWCPLDALLTLGSPLALWATRFQDFGQPISLPRWLNLWSRYDPISWPLQPLSPAWAAAVTADQEVCCGLTPASHCGYWRSPRVAAILAAELDRPKGT
jgi:hypothetical protein